MFKRFKDNIQIYHYTSKCCNRLQRFSFLKYTGDIKGLRNFQNSIILQEATKNQLRLSFNTASKKSATVP